MTRLGTMYTTVALAALCVTMYGQAPSEGLVRRVPNSFRGRRAVNSSTLAIEAPPDKVFPLLCPIREAEYADGWVGKVVYAVTGVAEEDGVYATEHEGEKDDTLWVVTQHDVRKRHIQVIYIVPGMRVVKLDMTVTAGKTGGSRVQVKYTNTGLSEAGNAEIAGGFEVREAFDRRMSEWQTAMNYYLKTGQRLKHQS